MMAARRFMPAIRSCCASDVRSRISPRRVRRYPHLRISVRGPGPSGTSTHLTRQLPGTHYDTLRTRMRLQESIFDIYLSIMAMALAMLVSGFLKEEISRPLSLLLAAMIGVLTVAKPILRFADRQVQVGILAAEFRRLRVTFERITERVIQSKKMTDEDRRIVEDALYQMSLVTSVESVVPNRS